LSLIYRDRWLRVHGGPFHVKYFPAIFRVYEFERIIRGFFLKKVVDSRRRVKALPVWKGSRKRRVSSVKTRGLAVLPSTETSMTGDAHIWLPITPALPLPLP
jgi:hypothetical protein